MTATTEQTHQQDLCFYHGIEKVKGGNRSHMDAGWHMPPLPWHGSGCCLLSPPGSTGVGEKQKLQTGKFLALYKVE